jgi:hypothetical protein
MIGLNTLYTLWHTAEAMDCEIARPFPVSGCLPGGLMAFARAKKHKRRWDKRNASAKRTDKQKGNDYVTDTVLADALEPLLEGLFLEGHTHVAAASPSTVAKLARQLERLLVAYGVVPQSKRAEDPQAYARNLQCVEDQAFREEFKARCGEIRGTRHLPLANIPDAETNSIVEPVSASRNPPETFTGDRGRTVPNGSASDPKTAPRNINYRQQVRSARPP